MTTGRKAVRADAGELASVAGLAGDQASELRELGARLASGLSATAFSAAHQDRGAAIRAAVSELRGIFDAHSDVMHGVSRNLGSIANQYDSTETLNNDVVNRVWGR